LKEVYPKIRRYGDCAWGTYAQRLIERTGPKGEKIYPLADLVEKIKQQLELPSTKRAAYELGVIEPFLDIPVYEPGHDRKYSMGGPCLSHISFKVSKEHRLYLTAVYRNHYYVQRAMGNLLGLAHLQYFVAKEAGIEVGPLACLSTCASLDTKSATKSSPGKWGMHDVAELLSSCHHVIGTEVETIEA
jgi:thymidylate synthase